MSEITLAKVSEFALTGEQRELFRGTLFHSIDGLSDADKKAWRNFWKEIIDAGEGEVFRVEVKKIRNGKFFRKWWALVNLAYEAWSDGLPAVDIDGTRVLPNFDEFRKDVTIKAGFYESVFTLNGDLKLSAKSISWAAMNEEKFQELYQATITAILRFVLPNSRLTAELLNQWVEKVIGMA